MFACSAEYPSCGGVGEEKWEGGKHQKELRYSWDRKFRP